MGSNCYRSRRFGTAAEAIPPGAARAAPRTFRVRPLGSCGLGERTGADLIAAAPLVNDFSEQWKFAGGEARHERPKGVRSSHIDLPRPPERPLGGIVTKQRSGWVLGQILCLAGESIVFGGSRSPNHRLPPKIFRIVKCCATEIGKLRLRLKASGG